MICIGPLQVDIASRALLVEGVPVRLGSRAFDLLAMLVAADGALVSKDALIRGVWPDTVVEENNLQVHMSALRKALGECRGLLQTVSGRGYRLARMPAGASVRPEPDASRVENNLPAPPSELIGRDVAIAEIVLALKQSRHVTLVGAGGIGKTRLALAVARSMLAGFAEGARIVSLASATDMQSVLATFASVLGLDGTGGELSAGRIGRELGEGSMLVVLDNCEHVLGPAAELADALASASDKVRLLATSRVPLKVAHERLYWVSPLEVPEEGGGHALQHSAVELFLARASAFDARFQFDERSVHLIGTVCRRLDGIPLAIELAAARAAVLGIETLAAHLDGRFALLTGGNRTALPRHQTLKATLDWSFALLDEAERVTLRRLAIFSNAFMMDAAIAVVRDDTLCDFDVMTAVLGLVEKSLVVAHLDTSAASYRLLETTRAYAMQKLEDNGERRDISLRHARYFMNLLDSAECDKAADFSRWHLEMRGRLGDLRAAFTWSMSAKGDAEISNWLATRVPPLLFELSLVNECCVWARRWLATQEGAEVSPSPEAGMRVRAALAAALVYVHGPDEETRSLWTQVLAAAAARGEHALEARALWGLWNSAQSAGAVSQAMALARRFATLARERGESTPDLLLGDRMIAIASTYAGEQANARASLERFLEHAEPLRHRLPLGRSVDQGIVGRATLARILWLQGERERALDLAETSAGEAEATQQAIVSCYVSIEALVPLALLSHAKGLAAGAIASLADVSARAGLPIAQACARAFEEYLHSLDATRPARLQTFRDAIGALDDYCFGAPRAMLVARYALLLGQAGWFDQALSQCDDALRRCMETGDRWYEAELHRTRGEVLLPRSPAEAESCFGLALDIARTQGCVSLQLRAAANLAGVWHAQGRHVDSVRLLTEVSDRLAEGREWEDHQCLLRLLEDARAAEAAQAPPRTFVVCD